MTYPWVAYPGGDQRVDRARMLLSNPTVDRIITAEKLSEGSNQ